MATPKSVVPRTFFLNESHEHARDSQGGGGSVSTFLNIDWASKGETLAKSFRAARRRIDDTTDPLRGSRYFLLSLPATQIQRASKDKRAKDGSIEVVTDFSKDQSRIFERLGIDLLRVNSDGNAIVHAKAASLDQLESTAARLGTAGPKERNRWAFINDFTTVPQSSRVDERWLGSLPHNTTAETIIELQPLLNRAECISVAQAIRSHFNRENGEDLIGAGRDISGRQWLRLRLRSATIERLAFEFQSIQSIHEPLRSIVFADTRQPAQPAVGASARPFSRAHFPTVAIVDCGVPKDHEILSQYRRGEFRHAESPDGHVGDHGSRVAARVVFGDLPPIHPGFVPPPGSCNFYDAVVPSFPIEDGTLELDDKAIFETIRDVARNAPDVRVFNLSLGSRLSLARMSDEIRQERYVEMQDLDNFAFQNDVIVVVAAGNTPLGVVPSPDYPRHLDHMDWGLSSPAAGFNTLVVGSFVGEVNFDGVARRPGWPSPFTRIGPGIADAPVPNFSASGGDATNAYRWRAGQGLGVTSVNQLGDWEDVIGTSFAAPIVARQAALACAALKSHCKPGVEPFASTIKAFLAFSARHRTSDGNFPTQIRKLAGRTLGHGEPATDLLSHPDGNKATFVWQGTLERPGHAARLKLPIPRAWLKEAKAPQLRAVCAWNTPVFAGAPNVWACRKVELHLRPDLNAPALLGKGKTVGAYPLIDRTYDLSAIHLLERGVDVSGDEWVFEIEYQDVGPYPPLSIIDEAQRVGVVVELCDADTVQNISPQAAVQAMPITATMIQLGGAKVGIWAPIKIPTG
jgi:hypothetical protein